ncbi:MmgE/PrpD family protein [Pseudonocardia adelaidensis]|uniref:MmgE/PrpD family protein n=1 Tax=Pseudonocardia adelaidensis TaxID=648754 RepID=A0ABP9NRW2_9PSEU
MDTIGAAPPPPATTPEITATLAEYVAASPTRALPEDIVEKATLHVLDTLAAIIACHDLEPARVARAYAARNSGALTTPILGATQTASLTDAVFATAMTAHAAEINDFCPSSYVQPGPAVVSTALLLGREQRIDGVRLLRAVVAGYEVACRLPKAIGAEAMRGTGVANHGIGAIFGAAVAAASVLGHRAGEVEHLLSLTAQQASGSWQWLLDVEHVEKALVFAGMGARSGLQSALFVEAGFTGVPGSFDHDRGWLRSTYLAGGPASADHDYLVRDLGTRFELPLVGLKQFPVGGPTQPAVQALLDVVPDVQVPDVARVLVELPSHNSRAFAEAGMPALNVPYLTSIILLDGRLDFVAAQSLARMAGDPEVRALMRKVEVRADPAQNAMPRVESARVTIVHEDGSSRTRFVEHVKGFPSHPMSKDDVVAKAKSLVQPHLGPARTTELCDAVLGMARLERLDPLIDLMARV